jgi:hypothetical protein
MSLQKHALRVPVLENLLQLWPKGISKMPACSGRLATARIPWNTRSRTHRKKIDNNALQFPFNASEKMNYAHRN